jgi:putative transposase
MVTSETKPVFETEEVTMRSFNQSTRLQSRVQDFVAGLLLKHVPLDDYGRTCPVNTLVAVLLFAAVHRLSISAAANQLRDAPSDETVRKALLGQLPADNVLEEQLNAALCDRLPKSLTRKRRPWAIDIVQLPYYGKSDKEGEDLRTGKPSQGTTTFHAFATLYLIHRGERFTLAMTYLWQSDTLPDMLKRLIDRVRKQEIQPKYLLLDRQFYNLDVVEFLQRHRVPFVIPVVHRGRRAKDPAKAKGTQQFLACKRSCLCDYTMRNRGRTAKVRIVVAVDKRKSKGAKRGARQPKAARRVLAFATWGFKPRSPASIREEYRQRFGVESSYRQMHQAQAWTTSRRSDVRLLLVGLALLLRNVWVWLHRCLISQALPNGAFQIHPDCLRLYQLLIYLDREILLEFGMADLPPLPTPT